MLIVLFWYFQESAISKMAELKLLITELDNGVICYQHSIAPSAYNISKTRGYVVVKTSRKFGKKFPLGICKRSRLLRNSMSGGCMTLQNITEDALRQCYTFLSHGIVELYNDVEEQEFLKAAGSLEIVCFEVRVELKMFNGILIYI
jgi:hypothetical protein